MSNQLKSALSHLEEVWVLPSIDVKFALVKIIGDTALLTDRFPIDLGEIVNQGKPTAKNNVRDPQQEFLDSQYICEDGKHGIPAGGLKASGAEGARHIKEVSMKMAWGSWYVVGELTCIKDDKECCEIVSLPPKMHVEPVPIASGNGKTLSYRAKYWPWSVTFLIRYDSDAITLPQIAACYNYGGFHYGLGAYRPEHHGTNGMYHVDSVTLLEAPPEWLTERPEDTEAA